MYDSDVEGDAPEAGAPEIEMTPAMIEAGTDRLLELVEQRESAYVVEQVFLAMWESMARSR